MIKIDDVAKEYRKAKEKMWPHTAARMRRLLVRGLSPLQRKVYARLPLFEGEQAKTGKQFANILDIKINHANNILKRLHELGLAERFEVIDQNGRHYVYRELFLGNQVNEVTSAKKKYEKPTSTAHKQ